MVFVGLCGLPYSGKSLLAHVLCEHFNFQQVRVERKVNENEIVDNDGTASVNLLCNSESGLEPEVEDSNILSFPDLDKLLDYVTENWLEDFVFEPVDDEIIYEKLSKRPFFYMIQLDCPMALRFRRSGRDSLEDFMLLEDSLRYERGLAVLFGKASLTILNEDSREALQVTLQHLGFSRLEDKINLTRPNWDMYFMSLAELASRRTNCMKRSVGAILVRDLRIVATGYNGTAHGTRNCNAGGCGRCNGNAKCGQSLDSCLCLHAEENAMLAAGLIQAHKATLYSTTAPCLSCAKKICQVGIRRVVYSLDYSVEHFTEQLLKEAGIELVKFGGSMSRSRVVSTAQIMQNLLAKGLESTDLNY